MFIKHEIIIKQFNEPDVLTHRIVTALGPYTDELLTKMHNSTIIEVANRIGTTAHTCVISQKQTPSSARVMVK